MRKHLTAMVLGLSALMATTSLTVYAEEKNKTVVAEMDGRGIYMSEIDTILTRLANENNLKDKPVYANLKDDEKMALVREAAITRLLNDAVKKSNLAQEKDVKLKIFAIEEGLLRNEYLVRKAKESITPEKIRARYDELVKLAAGRDELRIRHILVTTEDEAKAIAKELAAKPESFDEVAQKKSKDPTAKNGGDIGYVLEGSIVKEISDTAISLKKGQVSGPVKTQFGWHIVKLEDRRPSNILPYDTAKAKVEQELTMKIIQDYQKSLLDSAKIVMVKS